MAAYVKSTLSRTAEQADSRIWTQGVSHPKQESNSAWPKYLPYLFQNAPIALSLESLFLKMKLKCCKFCMKKNLSEP